LTACGESDIAIASGPQRHAREASIEAMMQVRLQATGDARDAD
jgi:hypothetical protein